MFHSLLSLTGHAAKSQTPSCASLPSLLTDQPGVPGAISFVQVPVQSRILTWLAIIALNLVRRFSDDTPSAMIILEHARSLVKNELGLCITTANAALAIIERANTAVDTAVSSHLERTLMSLQSSSRSSEAKGQGSKCVSHPELERNRTNVVIAKVKMRCSRKEDRPLEGPYTRSTTDEVMRASLT